MRKCLKYFFIGSAGVFLGVLVLGLFVPISPVVSPNGRTRNYISELYTSTRELAVENDNVISRLVNTTNGNLNSTLENALNGKSWFACIPVSITNPLQILDGWGRPMEIMRKTDLEKIPNVSSKLLRQTNLIIIWSDGPNGKNEFGNGDDVIFSPESP